MELISRSWKTDWIIGRSSPSLRQDCPRFAIRMAGPATTSIASSSPGWSRWGLAPAPEAADMTWLRRVTLDLTGLPPTPQEVTEFLGQAGDGEKSYAAVVDRLLQSPRYGERWAQHWLDVVRYADTHGFEVNTERPNAWPYRDYVIAAFNADTPYDRFIKEQMVGDAMGADAATGFLVTASVLLPGQIGKDAPSMRSGAPGFAGRNREQHRTDVSWTERRLRPVPRPQVRPDQREGLLLDAGLCRRCRVCRPRAAFARGRGVKKTVRIAAPARSKQSTSS